MGDNIKITENVNTDPMSNFLFLKEIAHYFMDFLETDFHKRKTPKRAIRLRNENNLLIGVNLSKYPKFISNIFDLIQNNFNNDKHLKVTKGVYKVKIPQNHLDFINLQIDKITEDDLNKIHNIIEENIINVSTLYKEELDRALSEGKDSIIKVIKDQLTSPFVSSIEKSLSNLEIGDDNTVYIIETELSEIIFNGIENEINECIKQYIIDRSIPTYSLVKEYFNTDNIIFLTKTYFEDVGVSDLFQDLYSLERNKNILDKQELYLNLFDVTFDKVKYPIFYIPFSLEKSDDSFTFSFDLKIFVNKKALEYFVQEYNKEFNKSGNINELKDRIIYLAQLNIPLSDLIHNLINEIINFFELDSPINVNSSELLVSKGIFLKVSNNLFITLFDKSDESLINDYEELLNLNEDSELLNQFTKLIDDFVHNDPKSFNNDIEEEWDNLNTVEKLVFKSPIPLNSEQLKILSALNKEDCKYIIVEGPPGTGKSHTITSIVFNNILNNKSVLVLSDKKEALDVVEEKISDTLNKVRIDKNFQNPTLRLGSSGNNYAQILSTKGIDDIRNHFKAVKKNYGTLEEDINKTLKQLKEDIEAEILSYNELDINEIKELIELEEYFTKNNIFIDIEECVSNNNSSIDLDDLRRIFIKLKDNINLTDYIFKNSEPIEQSSIDEIKSFIKLSGEILEFLKIHEHNKQNIFNLINIKEVNNIDEYESIKALYSDAVKIFSNLKECKNFISEIVNFDSVISNLDTVNNLYLLTNNLTNIIHNIEKIYKNQTIKLKFVKGIAKDDINFINTIYKNIIALKQPILGFLFKKSELEKLNLEFLKRFPSSNIKNIKDNIEDLRIIIDILNYIEDVSNSFTLEGKNVDFVHLIVNLETNEELKNELNKLYIYKDKNNSFNDNLKKLKWHTILNIKGFGNIQNLYQLEEYYSKYSQLKEKFVQLDDISRKILNIENDFHYYIFGSHIQNNITLLSNYCEILQKIIKFNEDIEFVNKKLKEYPKTTVNAKITNINSLVNNPFISISDLEFKKFQRFIILKQRIYKDFKNITISNYTDKKAHIEDLLKTQMTYLLDSRVVDFYDNNISTARAIREVIKSKKPFEKKDFAKLKSAFPCIISGIRDYAEYIPLESGLFDLVIIDEASQVSIAQAFPALLRAKKVIVFGDRKQFSNVKSTQARSDTNKEYLNNLESVFKKSISNENTKLVRLSKFNIKTSILEFFEFIRNANVPLLKHFRAYKEIISYSNKYFYNDNLQVMKIRGKSIDEIIKFTVLDHDGKKELIPNTNQVEADFIIDELKSIYIRKEKYTVGIITPHTNQQKLISEKISLLPEKDYFYNELKLKIMTFDTCQGEERDIIYYSMVANSNEDNLNYIFIKDLNSIDVEDDSKIKAQRLNVGLSRSKECIHFVLSKPINEFSGSIGEALRHFEFVRIEAQKERPVDEVDPNSPMEKNVLHWFYQTEFWKKNNDHCSFFPQFELGKYLKQMDKSYVYPAYKVDFLLIYKDEGQKEHKIIIEYDGFQEHFLDLENVNKYNYQSYYSEDDIYREKILESYGYKFIRINKFNIGDNASETLNKRIEDLILENKSVNKTLNSIYKTVQNLEDGNEKECPKCKEIRSTIDYEDHSLLSGIGRICNYCKDSSYKYKKQENVSPPNTANIANFKLCPKCGSGLRLRSGRYGDFLGCSRYPYCDGTRKI